MRLDRIRLPGRALAGAAVAALAATGLAACGGDDGEAQSLVLTLSGTQPKTPKTAEAGLAEITLANRSGKSADAQLVRVEGNHSAEEVIRGVGAAIEGKPLPDWLFAGGGVGTTAGGQTRTVSQVLEPGTYYAFNTESGGPPDPESVTAIKVTGEETEDELEEPGGEVEAIDYGFKASGLRAGRNEILFQNTGGQPHHILASKAIGDATAEDAERFFKTQGRGKPPIQEKGSQSTAVLEGGTSQLVTLDLKPGRYVLYCFITDRQGGPPHALKGMVDEVEVK